MTRRSYFDSNVVIHLLEPGSPFRSQARSLFEEESRMWRRSPVATPLVLGEVYVALTKAKGRTQPLATYREALSIMREVERLFDVHALTPSHYQEAIRIKTQRFQHWGLWDALHWASARGLGCTHLYTLDPPGGLPLDEEHRQVLEGVEFVDPFRKAPDSPPTP